jgi:DNA polymerase I
MPKLALLDGHSLAYRAFYALPDTLATPAGQVTNAVFGFTSMLIKLIDEERPDAICVAWDVRGGSFRNEQYAEYKAQRQAPPDLFREQLPLIEEVLDSLGISQVKAPGFEADDVLATLAVRAMDYGWEAVVVTGDRDAFQLPADGIRVMYTLRGVSDTADATAAWIEQRYGVTPLQYLDYAALRGDKSDNLPGIPGIGEKTAARLISSYGSLEGVFDHVDDQTPKLRQNLVENKERAFLNRDLMRLVRDVPLAMGLVLDSFMFGEFARDEARSVFDDLAFLTLWERLVAIEGGSTPTDVLEVDIRTASSGDLSKLAGAPVPLVTVSDAGEIVGVAVARSDTEAFFIPADRFDELAEAAQEGIVGHDIKEFVRLLLDLGLPVPSIVFDTALAAYLIHPGQRVPSLDALAERELGVILEPDIASSVAVQASFDFEGINGPDLDAAGRRAVAVMALWRAQEQVIEMREERELLDAVELPLIPILAHMEHVGIKIDTDFLRSFGDELRGRLGSLEVEIHEAGGGPFNINSTAQLREVLFDRLGLPVLKKTPKGVPSTNAAVLQKLESTHPIVSALLQYRELEKLRSTYVDALLPLVDEDGRVRGTFNQMAAATGRLSQEAPNLQNIPIRSAEGRRIRSAFVAESGHQFVVADYSQIELRILAHLSADSGLVRAFENGEDVHTATAARVNAVEVSEVTPDMRRRAKAVNFGLLYGMEAYGLAQRLEISRDEAQDHIDSYFSQFPGVRSYLQSVVAEASSCGYTTTILGRRRYLPELSSGNFRERQMGERMALNAPIQGSAADIMKKAMVDLELALRREGLEAEMLLQIHDEVVLEAPDAEVAAVAALTEDVLKNVVTLSVPLDIDIATGRSLAECKG